MSRLSVSACVGVRNLGGRRRGFKDRSVYMCLRRMCVCMCTRVVYGYIYTHLIVIFYTLEEAMIFYIFYALKLVSYSVY